ncbi:MAG: hypothetical protein SF066_11230 [Thermoanaerobaculia bacterium]|nr:hypothetical protein [Thermoanaerobaculia bacterium]
MVDLVLLRCHRDPALCRERLALLGALAPEAARHAVFGGAEQDLAEFRQGLGDAVVSCVGVPGRAQRWKWLHGDLVLLDWYRAHGRHLKFDRLIFWEWDLLALAPLAELYRRVPAGAVAVTGLAPLDDVLPRWSWSRSAAWRRGWDDLRTQLQADHGFAGPYRASQGPGLCLPRAFLDRYAAAAPPAWAHDEVRLPAYAAALGFPLVDTGWMRAWHDPAEAALFNCDSQDITPEVIAEQLAQPRGRRVFHPVRGSFPWREALDFLAARPSSPSSNRSSTGEAA